MQKHKANIINFYKWLIQTKLCRTIFRNDTKCFLIRFVHHLVTFAWHNWNITYDKTCVRQKYSRYFQKLRYFSLICYIYPDRDTLYQLSQKCVTYRKYMHRSILHFSLGEVGMGKNIMCFLSWLACFLFFCKYWLSCLSF